MQGAVLPPPPRCLQAQKHQHINNKGEALAVIVPSMQERERAQVPASACSGGVRGPLVGMDGELHLW